MAKARCAVCGTIFPVHPSRNGTVRCPKCGTSLDIDVPPSQSSDTGSQGGGGSGFSARSGYYAAPDDNLGGGFSSFDGGNGGNPEVRTKWEEKGDVTAFFDTIMDLATKPGQTFGRMPTNDSKGVLSFYCICGIISGFLTLIINILTRNIMGMGGLGSADPDTLAKAATLSEDADKVGGALGSLMKGVADGALDPSSPGIMLCGIIAICIGVPIGLYATAGITHVSGLITGATQRDFSATLRAVGYGAFPCFLNVIPVVGSALAGPLTIIYIVIGFSKLHKVSMGKAALTYFLPFIVVLCCTCGIGMAMAGMRH